MIYFESEKKQGPQYRAKLIVQPYEVQYWFEGRKSCI